MKIKQHTLKQAMSQKRNHKEIRKYLETNENKNTHTKTDNEELFTWWCELGR